MINDQQKEKIRFLYFIVIQQFLQHKIFNTMYKVFITQSAAETKGYSGVTVLLHRGVTQRCYQSGVTD